MIALDASALIAFLFKEPGQERVAALIPEACMSSVNLSEVLGYFARTGAAVEAVAAKLQDTPIDWVPFTVEQAEHAAKLLPVTRDAGLSLGDRACLALALQRGIAAITADRAWHALDLDVPVELIR
ncbi:MAG: type II toxin-antitoxin system VapC family toxin [Kiloniellaceae bacterium]